MIKAAMDGDLALEDEDGLDGARDPDRDPVVNHHIRFDHPVSSSLAGMMAAKA